jgi:hypothetical protein
MVNMRTDASPLGERFNLETVIQGIADDITALRAGQISIDDARTRAELAKQFMNGVRLVINAQKYLEDRARLIGAAAAAMEPAE